MKLPACTLVIFGATGDLAKRKIIPALHNLHAKGLLQPGMRIIAVGRQEHTDQSIRQHLRDSRNGWDAFAKRISYHRLEFHDDAAYGLLKKRLGARPIFYFATPPDAFPVIAQRLHDHKIEGSLVFEKPFGIDLASARALNAGITKHFKEQQIYRIDHYLGKEFVQNIMVLRFTNSIFAQLWNAQHIDNVQIIVGEQEGIGERGKYYDNAGALRDMVQNHLLQLLALTTMEEPRSLDPDDMRDEKAKLLKRVDAREAVLGQYTAGEAGGKRVRSYRDERDVAKGSTTETYAAVKLSIASERWRGTPFYLSSGKALKHKYAQVVITFKQVPCSLFCGVDGKLAPNTLVMRIQPDEGVSLRFNLKEVGIDANATPHTMEFSHEVEFGMNTPEAYERLLGDVMRADQTLFTRWDEVEQQWRIIDALITKRGKVYPYKAGTNGPVEAARLLAKDGRAWSGDIPLHQHTHTTKR